MLPMLVLMQQPQHQFRNANHVGREENRIIYEHMWRVGVGIGKSSNDKDLQGSSLHLFKVIFQLNNT